MPLPAHNLDPAFNIVRLSHIELGVTDLAKSRAFYVDVLGMQVSGEDDSRIYLRAMEERGHHCLVLSKASAPAAGALGFKLFSEADLDKAKAWFDARDIAADWVERPYQGRTLLASDPCARAG